MKHELRWADSTQQIMIVTFEGDFSWEENLVFEAEIRAMLDTVDHTVDVILDVERITPPRQFTTEFARIAKESPLLHHPHIGKTVICSKNVAIKWMTRIFSQLFIPPGKQIFQAPAVDQALEMLKRPQAPP